MSIKLLLLIISVLIMSTIVLNLSTANAANSVIVPQTRITEADKVEQHLRVQQEIFKHLSILYTYLPQYGYDSTSAADSVTIVFSDKYLTSGNFAATVTPMSPCDSTLWTSTFTDSSFVVHNPNTSLIRFDWISVGRKK